MEVSNSPARERVLTVAERLFSERGFAAVTMRDIAAALQMRQASLYHHAPGGKEQLFVEVIERGLARHQDGMARAVAEGGSELRGQLRSAARWLLSQPPMDLTRLFRSDVLAIEEQHAYRLVKAVYFSLMKPIEDALQAAYERGEIRIMNWRATTIAFLTLVEAIDVTQRYAAMPREALADDTVDLLLDGLHRR